MASVGGPSTSSSTSVIASASSSSTPAQETICLDDSLDEDLSYHSSSLDLVSEALAVINNGNKGPSVGSRLNVPTTKPRPGLREEKLASIMSKLPLATPKKLDSTQTAHSSSLIAGHTGPVPKKPQDLAHTGISSGLIAGSSIQNPKVSLEPLPARLLQQGLQRASQIHASSSSQTHVSSTPAPTAYLMQYSIHTPILWPSPEGKRGDQEKYSHSEYPGLGWVPPIHIHQSGVLLHMSLLGKGRSEP